MQGKFFSLSLSLSPVSLTLKLNPSQFFFEFRRFSSNFRKGIIVPLDRRFVVYPRVAGVDEGAGVDKGVGISEGAGVPALSAPATGTC